ncbi:MAG: glycosyltransferase [Xanthobacteraceae bacterium]|nr:glycosyltransferase [Xanthobacteraceae bacterium]
MTSVTAALIVRDEAAVIADCLRSLAGRVDEIVVVDTGSRDDTIDIATKFPIRLHHFTWCDDFSAARNFALEQARSDWILYIDADERLDVPDDDALPRALADGTKVAWRLRLHPRVGWTGYSELRLFRNDPRIRFRGVIHETIWPGIEAVMGTDGREVGSSDLSLHHVGYEADQRPKNPRNIPLLRDHLARDPDNLFCWWHLGDCLRLAGDEEAAAEAWANGIARHRALAPDARSGLGNSILHLALLKLRHRRGEAVDDLLAEALENFPDNLALQWMVAQVAVDRGDHDTARPILERLLAIDGDAFFEPQLAYDKALFSHLSAELLALCAFRDGRFDEAARLYREAAHTSPDPEACAVKARLAELRASALPTRADPGAR